MRTAIVQTNPVFGDLEGNISQALSLMSMVPADLYVLPELFATCYNFLNAAETSAFAEEPQGRTFQRMHDFAKVRQCHLVYGFAEKADKIYNSAALVGPNGLVGVYRKVHLYAKENELFSPGNFGFPVFDLPIGKIGIMICFDWVYPESARTLAINGAQIIAHPSNLVMPYCPDAMVTRCLENRIFAATANRIGAEDRGGLNLRYIGNSEIVSPNGEILVRLHEDECKAAAMDIDVSAANNKKINPYNDLLAGRREDQYSK
jgi:predicted amidohydrolase